MKKSILIEILVFLLWCLTLFLTVDFERTTIYFWVEALFVIGAFFIVAYTFATDANTNESTVETGAVTYIYSVIYLCVCLVSNSFHMIVFTERKNKLMLIMNGLVLIAYVAILMASNNATNRANRQTQEITQRIIPIAIYSNKIGSMISLAKSESIKKALLDLKKQVDYSTNLSQSATAETEDLFEMELNQIQEFLIQNVDESEIMDAITRAKSTWLTRVSIASSIR